MRFLLDQNVDASVVSFLRAERHECFTVAELGLAGARDDEVSVRAHEDRAIVVTHDRDFSRRRIRNTYGQHLWLRCREFDAIDVLRRWLPTIELEFVQQKDLVLAISANRVTVYPPSWK